MSFSHSRYLSLLVIAVLFMATSAQAQLVSAWSSVPAGPTAVVGMEQSYVFVREGSTVRAFSSLTKTWSSITCIFGMPVVYNYNEHLIVRDGPMFHAYSPRTSAFSSQFTASPSAALIPPTGPQTWHSAIVDGNTVHVYFALHGTWLPISTVGAASVNVGRLCLLINDATGTRAVSSYWVAAVPCPETGGTVLGAYGATAAVLSPFGTSVWAFSAHLNTWRQQFVTGPVTATSNGLISGIVAIRDSLSVHFFSSHTGLFTSVPTAPNAAVYVNRQVGIVVDGNVVTGYSGILGTTASIVVPSGTVNVDPKDFFAIIRSAAGVSCFSAPAGQFSATMPGTTWIVLSGGSHQSVCMLVDGVTLTPAQVYTSILNQWVPAPSIPGSLPYVRSDLAALQDPNGGLFALAATETNWAYQPAPPNCTVTLGTSSLVARNGSSLFAFNPRKNAWRTTTTTGPIVGSAQHMCAAVFWDATTLYGWSTFTDRFETSPLSGAVTQSNAEIYNGWVRTATTLHAFGGAGEVLTTTDFPDYVRVATAGSPFRLDLSGAPNAPALLVASLASAEIPTAWGTLWIDPNAMSLLAAPVIPAGGTWGMSLLVPPGLAGTTVHFQAALFTPNGPTLTNSAQVRLY